MKRYHVTNTRKPSKTIIGYINLDPREWIVRRIGAEYFGV